MSVSQVKVAYFGGYHYTPHPVRREFNCKLLNLLARWGQKCGSFPGSLMRKEIETLLASIFAEPMTDNLEKAIRYAFKAVESGRLEYDDSFVVLPRTLSEVP
jgi:hypothetical protein